MESILGVVSVFLIMYVGYKFSILIDSIEQKHQRQIDQLRAEIQQLRDDGISLRDRALLDELAKIRRPASGWDGA